MLYGQPYVNGVRAVTRIDLVDCTVLIVDDHPSFRASARVLLE